jgi:hypothetical protein
MKTDESRRSTSTAFAGRPAKRRPSDGNTFRVEGDTPCSGTREVRLSYDLDLFFSVAVWHCVSPLPIVIIRSISG